MLSFNNNSNNNSEKEMYQCMNLYESWVLQQLHREEPDFIYDATVT